jgi:hypothetical protein
MRNALLAAGFLIATVVGASATPITFVSTVNFTGTTGGIHFTSPGLNTSLTVGDAPTVISNFIVAKIDNGATPLTSGILNANFVFSSPTVSGVTVEQAALSVLQVNGANSHGSLSINWPFAFDFTFTDGTELSVVLSDVSQTCTGNNCIAKTYNMSATVQAIAGPKAAAVPEPLTLSVFGMGLADAVALRRRKKAAKA